MGTGWWTLPGEIRNEIHELLLEAGDLAMMRTNKQASQEMLGLVWEKAWYRMYMCYPQEPHCRSWLPQGQTRQRIQQVEVHWILPCPWTGSEWRGGADKIGVFRWDPMIRRKRCVVYLEKAAHKSMSFGYRELDAWSSLAGFEEVIFHVAIKDCLIAGNELCVRRQWDGIGGKRSTFWCPYLVMIGWLLGEVWGHLSGEKRRPGYC